MMPRRCTVCGHPSRDQIDQQIATARDPYRAIARRFGVSRAALFRHLTNHLPARLAEAARAEEVSRADQLLNQVEALRDRTLVILDKAEHEGDLRVAVAAIREARGCVELLAKIAGELQDRQTVNVLVSPEWATARALVVEALAPFPDARVAVASALKELPRAG